jgi:lysophospholipase L1-like esterase
VPPLRRAAASLTLTAALLGAVEGALRLAAPDAWLAFDWELPSAPRASPVKPGAPLRTVQDGPYTWRHGVDERGLREDEVPDRAPEGTFRILAVGDSWIYGYGADRGATLPDALEQLLPAALGVSRVEVINAGWPGANVSVIRRTTQGLVKRFPDIRGVLLGQPHNPRNPGKPRKRGTPEPPPDPAVYTYAALRRAFGPLFWRNPPRNNAVGLEDEVADMGQLAQELQRGGRVVWLALFPHEQTVALSRRFGPEREWLALPLPMAGHALDTRACWGWEDPYHPSPAGYRAIAEALVPVISGEARFESWVTTPTCGGVDGWPGP